MKITSFLFLFIFLRTNAQSPSAAAHRSTSDAISNFQPSLAVVISMLAVMFSLTLFILLYAKLCHHPSTTTTAAAAALPLSAPGLDRSLIESLPFFHFSSLHGSRAGLECAVCLVKFDDADVLRLLPKCNHAFHIACIDQWLEKNSTCPLCRRHVTAGDLSASLRFLQNPAPAPDSNLELYVEREESRHGSSRFCIDEEEEETPMHRLKHKIVVLKSRWSNVSSNCGFIEPYVIITLGYIDVINIIAIVKIQLIICKKATYLYSTTQHNTSTSTIDYMQESYLLHKAKYYSTSSYLNIYTNYFIPTLTICRAS